MDAMAFSPAFQSMGLRIEKKPQLIGVPQDKTVLANEQVVLGKCERCEAEVVQKQMLQWNMKITEYADRLIEDPRAARLARANKGVAEKLDREERGGRNRFSACRRFGQEKI